MSSKSTETFSPEMEWDSAKHYYTKVLNAQLHSLVKFFHGLSPEQLVARYTHMNPKIDKEALTKLLRTPPKHFRWSGADLFYSVDLEGNRQMIVVETNSCPSGMKSFPFVEEKEERNGYAHLIKRTFLPALRAAEAAGTVPEGALAVLHDKNDMETKGYATTMAQLAKEKVYWVPMYKNAKEPNHRWTKGNTVLEVKDGDKWVPIRGCFRYVTQKPWNRLPVRGNAKVRTFMLNPSSVCLSGGRNKLVADKAYELFNLEHADDHLEIRTPVTIRDLRKNEVPMYVRSWGGVAVVKVPMLNAGQGIYCITKEEDLQAFMEDELDTSYDTYIIQQLVGNSNWSSRVSDKAYYHLGLVPSKSGDICIADVRMMTSYDYKVGAYRPLALYARRAESPLLDNLEGDYNSWSMLGTNLSVKQPDGSFTTDTTRLLIMDSRDFNRLGLSLDDLIEAFFQTLMATTAIDQVAHKLQPETGWNDELYRSLINDDTLIGEIMHETDE